jgi:predicted Rossmann fold flavoprotein
VLWRPAAFHGELRRLTLERPSSCDVAIVGAGAAGLATAIFTRRLARHQSVVVCEGAKKPGAKILVSGGSRCNVTNASVTDADFWGGRRAIVRRVLRAFPVSETVAFFREIGVRLHEEADGKLFPDSNRARDVLDALLREADNVGAGLLADHRVLDLTRDASGFSVVTARGDIHARAVVIATGGQSLPKSGSDGAGFEMARRLGHTIVPTTPGLVPLVLAQERDLLHRELSGVAHEAELTVWVDGAAAVRLTGAMLWTHFGISGPLALNVSRHWLSPQIEGRTTSLTLNFCPGEQFDEVDARWTAMAAGRPNASVQGTLATMVPASVAAALLRRLAIDGTTVLAHFTRNQRRTLAHSLVAWPLPVVGTRGYNYAEVTAGGVALHEIDPSTMRSRVCPGLSLVGEILNVDGRIGGFNFQWAWASARVAAVALAEPTRGAARA